MKTFKTFDQFINEEYDLTEKLSSTDIKHLGLDILGFVPILGEPADIANAMLYIKEKNYLFAALSVIAIIPEIGDVIGKGGKYSILGYKATKASNAIKSAAPYIIKLRNFLAVNKPLIDNAFDMLDKGDSDIAKKLKPFIPMMKEAIDLFIKNK